MLGWKIFKIESKQQRGICCLKFYNIVKMNSVVNNYFCKVKTVYSISIIFSKFGFHFILITLYFYCLAWSFFLSCLESVVVTLVTRRRRETKSLGRLNKLSTNIYVENRASCSGKAPHLYGITITVRTQKMLSIFVVFLSHLKRIPQW
jgi:hypothetical protein